jgi:amino-acid N-acetyltransferase
MEKIKQVNIRKAQIKEAREIFKIIDYFAKKNLLLPRSLNEIYENIRDFWIAQVNQKIVGCCSLHPYREDLAEIRSLAILPEYQKQGIGKKLLNSALKEARELGIEKVFTLTYQPEFFKKNNFKPTEKEKLPQKIWRDCCQCLHFPVCKEEALVIKLNQKGGLT